MISIASSSCRSKSRLLLHLGRYNHIHRSISHSSSATQTIPAVSLGLYTQPDIPVYSIGSTILANINRNYVSRAHPKPKPTFHIKHALQMVLEGCEERRVVRQERWDNYISRMIDKSEDKADPGLGDYRNVDENVEIVIHTGLDPRKPNQLVRGSTVLPHGTGKLNKVCVFTSAASPGKNDDDSTAMVEQLTQMGASFVGAEPLIDDIKNGNVSLSEFDRTIASQDMVPKLGQIARILGPRGLMPNVKLGTVVPDTSNLPAAVKRQLSGVLNYRVDKTGNVHVVVGKWSFGSEKLLENIAAFMNVMQDNKPEGNKGKYMKQVYITALQGKGIKIDLKTVDPGSAFFMVDGDNEDKLSA